MVVSFYQSISVSSPELTFESRPSSGILQKLQQVVSSAPGPIIRQIDGEENKIENPLILSQQASALLNPLHPDKLVPPF